MIIYDIVSLVENNIFTAEAQRTQRIVIFDLRGDDRKSKGLIPSGNKQVARIVIAERRGLCSLLAAGRQSPPACTKAPAGELNQGPAPKRRMQTVLALRT